jgi:hypothetical protein
MRSALIAAIGLAFLVFSGVASSASEQSPTLKIVGFASILPPGNTPPRIEARTGGTITKCRDRKSLSAIFLVGGLRSGSRYQQYWSSKGKTVFLGKVNTLSGSIGAPTRVFMGFEKKTALKNGKYIFQFIHNGRPYVLGSVTRKC